MRRLWRLQKQQSFEGATISNKLEKLPQRVRTMRDEIYRAARSGDLLVLREVLEVNELHPLTGSADERDPIKFWKKASADGEGAQIMAVLSAILEPGFAHLKAGTSDEMFVWPYLAALDLKTLKPHQIVDLHRLHGTKQAMAMIAKGRYSGYTLGIAPDGTWHYFWKAK